MSALPPDPDVTCPDPWARAPLVHTPSGLPTARLLLPPPALQGAIAAVICRDIRGQAHNDAQRLSHFPASPLLSLSWYQDAAFGLVERQAGGCHWKPFQAPVMISGSQSQPCVTWAPASGRGGMICFTADVARVLFGVDPADVHDRFVPAQQVLGEGWLPLCEALLAAPDDAATLAALQRHLAPRWQALHHRATASPSLRQLGRHWVERLGLQAHEWRRTHSPRHVERRVKAYSGRSLREWQSLVRTEGVFFAARERYEAGEPLDWASLALDEGFADQSHFVRATRRITGFAPAEFAARFASDESFWVYRLWV